MTWEDAPRDAPPADRTAQIASLTGLRGVSALMVVLIHVSVLTRYPWVGIPDYGPVSLFVLSGFLLSRPWARWALRLGERPSVRTFAFRRIVRIFPAYLVVLVAVCAVYPPARPDGPGQWLRAATLTWIYRAGDFRAAFQQTWSLGTELSWYVALPVLGGLGALAARRTDPRRGYWLLVALLSTSLPVSVAWRWYVDTADLGRFFTYSYWLPGYLVCFAVGALVALTVEGRRAGAVTPVRLTRLAADPWAVVVLALAVALLGTSALGGANGFSTPITLDEHLVRAGCATGVAALLLLGAVLGPRTTPLNRALASRWLQAVGRWSYGVFLWHLPLITVLDRDVSFQQGPAGLAWRLVLTLALAVPLGAATYAWVERPTLDWSRRFLDRGSTSTPSTASQPSSPNPAPVRSDAPAE
ncbi:peptidoglycan/LPS O-acetylase OafA/YrhL [Nocardioides aurantiacus]|uniref:Peptidoglycan/LPS O-acetylase OafA/YrhL n=1 Tax=Nocardioides aurantiacus TaxID=86796 RepID=A0A3N2CVC3_9ACTN|nr:peptidoglycan/LPS O-acetylase OafA/YrhL [Nocardioides aurantiacus]